MTTSLTSRGTMWATLMTLLLLLCCATGNGRKAVSFRQNVLPAQFLPCVRNKVSDLWEYLFAHSVSLDGVAWLSVQDTYSEMSNCSLASLLDVRFQQKASQTSSADISMTEFANLHSYVVVFAFNDADFNVR